MNYDLVILGGGVAGTTAALLAAEKGLLTALVYDAPLGGVCLHAGCIPAKVCLQREFPDHATRCAARQQTVQTLYEGLVARLEDSGVDLYHGHGTYTKKEAVFCVTVGTETLLCSYVILATGSKAVAFPGTRTVEDVFTSDVLPQSAVIIGAGAAGLEAASYLNKTGAKVTLLEQGERLLPMADPEISNALLRSFRRKGISVQLHTSVQAVEDSQVITPRKTYGGEWIVSALGRKAEPVAPAQNLFVVGDAKGHHCTAHAAMREAECAVRQICGEADTVDYNCIPDVVFCDPQCATIGRQTDSAATVMLKGNGGYMASGGDGSGVLKLFAKDGIICGLQICGGSAAEVIGIGSVLVSGQISVRALCAMTFPHPTVSEAIHTAAMMLMKGQSHDSQ